MATVLDSRNTDLKKASLKVQLAFLKSVPHLQCGMHSVCFARYPSKSGIFGARADTRYGVPARYHSQPDNNKQMKDTNKQMSMWFRAKLEEILTKFPGGKLFTCF